MGDFLTHVAMSERVPCRIESHRIAEGIRANLKLFRLGSQGPDPMFFHHCFPGDGKGELVKVGKLLHSKRTGSFLAHGFRQLSPVSWSKDWMQLAVWLCGAVCHFFTDKELHPYVNAAEHNWIWSEKGVPVKTSHGEVERQLDVIMWRSAGHGSASRARLSSMCPGPGPWPDPIVNFWVTALFEVYDILITEKMLGEAARDFHRGNSLLYDPHGVKKGLLTWVNELTGGAFHPAKLPHPEIENTEIDWMNHNRRSWFQPELPDTRRTESVDMLIDKAVDGSVNSINGLFAVLFRQQGRLEQWLPNLDYNSGLPCVDD